ncbi:MAG: RNA polymerase sigma factor [Chloroflexota bacterium]
MSDDRTEQALLVAAVDGDMEAYEVLQIRLEPDMRRYIGRKIYDPFTVDDMLQEVFLKFYQNMHRIDPIENLRPYIYRIARNTVYDHLRKVQRNNDISLDDEPVRMRVSFTEATHQPKPDDLTHWILLHMEVEEAINNLPESQRETLVLYSEEQMSYAEIADVMDCSIGTVKSRLYYAKKNLRGLLNPETVDVLDDEFNDTPRTYPADDESATDAEMQTTNNSNLETTEKEEQHHEQLTP